MGWVAGGKSRTLCGWFCQTRCFHIRAFHSSLVLLFFLLLILLLQFVLQWCDVRQPYPLRALVRRVVGAGPGTLGALGYDWTLRVGPRPACPIACALSRRRRLGTAVLRGAAGATREGYRVRSSGLMSCSRRFFFDVLQEAGDDLGFCEGRSRCG